MCEHSWTVWVSMLEGYMLHTDNTSSIGMFNFICLITQVSVISDIYDCITDNGGCVCDSSIYK